MKTSMHIIPLRLKSALGEYLCPDGEIESCDNMEIVSPSSLSTSSSSGSGSDSSSGILGSSPAAADHAAILSLLSALGQPKVTFSLQKTIAQGWHTHPDNFPTREMSAPKGVADGSASSPRLRQEAWGTRAAQLLSELQDDCRRQNLFLAPFFAIAAWRLADGAHVMPSSPVLLIPNSRRPVVEGSTATEAESMKMSAVGAVCSLRRRVSLHSIPDSLKGIVTHLDIFVSRPAFTLSSTDAMTSFHNETVGTFTHCLDSSGSCGEHPVCDRSLAQMWCHDDGEMDFSSILSDFRLVEEFDIDALAKEIPFGEASFNAAGLPLLNPSYSPEYAHVREIKAGGGAMISGRLTLWDLSLSPFDHPALPLCSPWADMPGYLPRFIFIPDPDARSYEFSYAGEVRRVALRRHPLLCGAYCWLGFGKLSAENDFNAPCPIEGEVKEPAGCFPKLSFSKRRPWAVWRSQAGNPWVFGDSLLTDLNVEKVIMLCRAFRASGLVATTSPTVYAFTSDGVFLLKEMADGSLRDAGLITASRLRDAQSVWVGDNCVDFITDGGVARRIAGTVVKDVALSAASSPSGSYSFGNNVIMLSSPVKVTASDLATHLDAESSAATTAHFMTRAMKLGDAEKWKRIRSVMLRGCPVPDGVSLELYGSNDLQSWVMLARGQGLIEAVWGPRMRFFKVRVEASSSADALYEAIVITCRN